MPFIWESSSFGGSILESNLPQSGSAYWSSSLGALSASIISGDGISGIYKEIGDPESSLKFDILGGNVITSWSRSSTTYPGLFSGMEEAIHFGLRVQFSPITFTYAELSSSLNRRGIYANAHSGSPQLSLQPTSGSLYEMWPGDIWYLSSASYEGENGYRFADENESDNSVFIYKPLFSRVGESSGSMISRYNTIDGPKDTNIAVTSIVSNDWFMTINSGTVTGRGWLNTDWGGGIYMPDVNTVAIYGGKNFEVPNGGSISASVYLGSMQSASYAATASYAVNGGGGGPVNFSTGSYTGSFTGSLLGTASYARTASLLLGSIESASYAGTASLLLGSIESSSYALTASYAANAGATVNFSTGSYTGSFTGSVFGTTSYAETASLLLGSIESSSYAATASLLLGSVISASYALTASHAETASVAQYATRAGIQYTFTASVAVTPSYVVISSGSQHLPTGIYIFSMATNGGQNINETYTGQLSWYAGNTNSTGSDEVIMHHMGESPGSQSLYLRTRRRAGGVPGYLELGANLPSTTEEYHFIFNSVL